MVLGLRSKQKKCAVHVEYIIHIHEIKPWPPSQSLKSLHSVVLHWENGDHQSGSTCIVIPDLGSGAAEGKLEFNESFKLQVTLLKEGSSKGNEKGTFQKNALEFNLYEPKRDKFKGQHLGSAVINLAEYGIVKEAVTANIPVTSKRSFRNIMQPVLYVKIQPMDDADMGSISGESLSKEVPVDKDVKESVSKLMNEENVEENEITSFTDDGISSLSALDHSSAQEVKADTLLHNDAEENKVLQNVPEIMNPNGVVGDSESKLCLPSVPTKLGSELKESHLKDAALHQNNALPESVSVGSLSITKGQENMNETHGESETSLLLIMESNIISTVSSSTQKIPEEVIGSSSTKDATNRNSLSQEVEEISIGCSSRENVVEVQVHVEDNGLMTEIVESSDFTLQAEVSNISESEPNIKQNGKTEESINDSEESINEHVADNIFKEKQMGLIFGAEVDEDHLTISQTMNGALESPVGTTAILEHISIIQQRETKQSKGTLSTDATLSSWRSLHERHNSSFSTERLRTMKLSVRSPPHSMGSITYGANEQDKEYVKEVDIQEDASNTSTNSGTDDGRDDNGSTSSGSSKAKQFPRRNGRILSNDKVHELELRVKSLEAELREAAAIEIALYSSLAEHGISAHKVHTPARRLSRMYRHASRQWPTERMTSAARSIASGLALVAKACGHDVARHSGRVGGAQQLGSFSSKSFGKQPSMVYPQQTNLSLEIWKKAFIDTSKLLCPLRSEGLECGCLPMLSRMVMEQCVARLDVAMFNAILRESDDEIPTDPMSDPIGDSKVLPIPTGSLSFGSGAQLKNAVGNWSRWLTDLFGMDVDESHADGNSQDEKISVAKSFKSFYSLNALSDLLMLPKDMLLEKSIRKEACSTFSPNVINHILNRFLPDEFCPDPVPNDVLQALESEEYAESSQEEIRSIPNNASPIIYSPPSTTSIESFIGEIRINSLTRIGSSVIRKCHQSDDELDEFDSPLSSIINGKSPSPKSGNKENDKFSSIRYQLLREVWRIDE
ncbi:hypothetical protein ZIOFF_005000 [Zingiber officinale]|uniref:C2 NT-type domain-containing protein n=1 Tax=Zingiber officinale TaxID=94328 RepID=A0A8J5I968_ZINOF|nr:hypothetical protein ZIOFF_005000 [Zingiber officinale]